MLRRRWLAFAVAGAVLVSLGLVAATSAEASTTGPARHGAADPQTVPPEVLALIAADQAKPHQPKISPMLTKPCGRLCDYQDPATFEPYPPSTFTCDIDATRIYQLDYVALAYSPFCQTTWALSMGGYTDNIFVVSQYQNHTIRALAVHDGGPWSPMLDDHALYNYACIRYFDSDGDLYAGTNPHYQCTGSY